MSLRHRLPVLLLALCAACTSTPQATRERDAEAKRFEPVTRDAVIYIYRPGIVMAGPETTLWVDNRLVGSSLPGTFFRVIVFPGRNLIDTSPPDSGRLAISTLASEVTFVEMRSEGGPNGAPVSRFRVMAPEEAKAAIAQCCSMLETWHHNQPRLFW